MKTTISRTNLFVIIVLLAAGYCGLKGLGNNAFWTDEAYVGIFARNFAKSGKLIGWESAWDGRNLYTYIAQRVLDERYRSGNPPLDQIVAAASFKVLGASTKAGRLPFVLAGIGALVLFWFFLGTEFGRASPARLYAFALLALSTSFLLNIRQCRYYSLALLLTLAVFYFYRQYVRTEKIRWAAGFAAATILLFYAHFLAAMAALAGIALVHGIFYLSWMTPRRWAVAGASAAVAAAAIIPYIIIFKLWARPDFASAGDVGLSGSKLAIIYWNLREIDVMGYVPFLIIPPWIFFALRYKGKGFITPVTLQHITFCAGYIVVLSMLSPQPPKWQGMMAGLADVRYLVPLMPLCACICAAFLDGIGRAYGSVLAWILAALMICTNWLTLNLINGKSQFLLPLLVYEIHNDYQTPYEAAIDFLKKNAAQDDLVYALPQYAIVPLQFYLTDKLRFGSVFRKDEKIQMADLSALNFPLFIEDYFPDWILFFSMAKDMQKQLEFFSRGQYAYQLHTRIDTFWKDMTRPEIPWHAFGRPALPNDASAIYVFRRTAKTPAPLQPQP